MVVSMGPFLRGEGVFFKKMGHLLDIGDGFGAFRFVSLLQASGQFMMSVRAACKGVPVPGPAADLAEMHPVHPGPRTTGIGS